MKRRTITIDVVVGISGCLAGVALAFVHLRGYGLSLIVICAFYLLFRRRILGPIVPSLPENKILSLILNVIFFFAFSVSLIAMHQSEHRPLIYFTLMSVSVVAVTAEILVTRDKPSQTWFLLLKILMISFNLRYGLLYDSPGFYGTDPWTHSMFIEEWLKSGHLSTLTSIGYTEYAIYPGMHLNVMAMRLLTGANPKDSLFLAIGLFYILSGLFVFLLGQRIVSTRAGLLASLFVGINGTNVMWGAWLIPTSLGLGVLAMLLWLIIKRQNNVSDTFLIILTYLFLIISHTLSAFVIGVILLVLFGVYRAYRWLSGSTKEKILLSLPLVMLFWVGMLSYWIFVFYGQRATFFGTILGFFANTLRTDVQFTSSASTAAVIDYGIFIPVLNKMFIGFFVLGSLQWLSPKSINGTKVAIITGTLALLAVVYGTPMLNIYNFIPGRWLPFIAVLAAPIVAEGILVTPHLVDGRLRKSVLLVLVVFAFSFLLINNYDVNQYTPFLGKANTVDPERFAFKSTELQAVDTLSKKHDGLITTDTSYAKEPFRQSVGLGRLENLSPGSENKGLIVIRQYLYTHGEALGIPDDQSRASFLNGFAGAGYNEVYDNGEVKAYLPR